MVLIGVGGGGGGGKTTKKILQPLHYITYLRKRLFFKHLLLIKPNLRNINNPLRDPPTNIPDPGVASHPDFRQNKKKSVY
jgi:hypothetical protein